MPTMSALCRDQLVKAHAGSGPSGARSAAAASLASFVVLPRVATPVSKPLLEG